jgi:predicted  nucleic acid-binding Zn-ribbon protein
METQEARLARLEGAATRLAQLAHDLRRERDRLQDRLAAVEKERAGLRQEVTALRGERETIRKRLAAMDASLTKALAAMPGAAAAKEAHQSNATSAPAVETLTLL